MSAADWPLPKPWSVAFAAGQEHAPGQLECLWNRPQVLARHKLVMLDLNGFTDSLDWPCGHDWLNDLVASRKADRQVIAAVLRIIGHRHGAAIEVRHSDPSPGYSGQGIDLRFSVNGVGAMVGIDDLHGGNLALISWFNTLYPSRNFTSRFCAFVGDHGSMRPHHKATTCLADWYSLAMRLDAGLMLAARGEALASYDL